MPIDFSKISKEDLDVIIKEEALKMRAEMLSEQKKKALVSKLQEEKKSLLKQLEESDLDEGLFGKLFGGGGNDDAVRKQTVMNLLKHPNKGPELLKYASDEQVNQFKSYMTPEQASSFDGMLKRVARTPDPNRAESYIQFYAKGGTHIRWDANQHQYVDAAKIGAGPANAFNEGKKKS